MISTSLAGLDAYLDLRPDLNREDTRAIAIATLAAARLGTETSLAARWYRSLAAGAPDMAIYDDPDYVGELWACWVLYSSRYVRLLAKLDLDPGVVVDLGAGLGYSTAALVELYPRAVVEATDRGRSVPALRRVGARYGFDVFDRVGMDADLVFASEYFEHFVDPIGHLDEILERARPRYLVVANAFTGRAPGHFLFYVHAGEIVSGAEMTRRFHRRLRAAGYEQGPDRFWNERPRVFEKVR